MRLLSHAGNARAKSGSDIEAWDSAARLHVMEVVSTSFPSDLSISTPRSFIYMYQPSDSVLDNVNLLVPADTCTDTISRLLQRPTARNRVPPQHYYDTLLTRDDQATPTDLLKTNYPWHGVFAAMAVCLLGFTN